MDPQRYRRIKDLFDQACEMREPERSTWLTRACDGDAELRAEVEALLELDGEAVDDPFDRAVRSTSEDRLQNDSHLSRMPERIGRYRILKIHGVGGMGTVYEAEQEMPARRVAVKVLQRGMARPDLLRRFRREAEILGRLHHPCIGQIYEAGEFEQDGVVWPYIAMEFVDGLPVHRFAEHQRLGLGARRELMIRLCEAVHHAHQQGVIHRDLKPDNILVAEASAVTAVAATSSDLHEVGQPKILDFGVARLTDTGTAQTIATQEGQMIGSLPYMSPEQAAGGSGIADARSDVYALGVVFFELLTGRLPYDVHGKSLVDAVKTICEHEPMRLGDADTRLRGDLETILGKSLDKDPSRRYPSALELADDLRRQAQSLPIAARPPSATYQFRKFARRNRVLVAGIAATVLALGVGLLVALVYAVRAEHSAAEARRRAYHSDLTAAQALLSDDPLAAQKILQRAPRELRGFEWSHLHSLLTGYRAQFGPSWSPGPFQVDPSTGQLLAMRDATTLCGWDTELQEPATCWELPGQPSAVAVSGDGLRFACADTDGSIRVLERGADQRWVVWGSAPGPVLQLAFEPGAERLVALGVGHLSVVADGTVRSAELNPRWGIPKLAVHPDGGRIVLAEDPPGYARLSTWAIEPLAELNRVVEYDEVESITWSPDGSRVVCGTLQRNIRSYRPSDLQRDARYLGHTSAVLDLAWSPAGRLASVSRDGSLRIWSDPDICSHIFLDESARRVTWLGERALAITGSEGIRLWPVPGRSGLAASRVLDDQPGYHYDLAFSLDGSLLLSHAPLAPSSVAVWDLLTGELLRLREDPPGRSPALSVDVDGFQVISGGVAWGASLFGSPTSVQRPGWTLGWYRGPGRYLTAGAEFEAAKPGTRSIHRLEFDSESESGGSRLWIDGVEQVARSRMAQTWRGPGPHPQLSLGGRGNHLRQLAGDVIELLIYDDLLDAAAVASIERYLQERLQGREVTLPRVGSDGADLPLLARFEAARSQLGLTSQPGDRSDQIFQVVDSWTSSEDPGFTLRRVGKASRDITWIEADEQGPARVRFQGSSGARACLEAPFDAIRGRNRTTVFWLGGFRGEGVSRAFAIETPTLGRSSGLAAPPPQRRVSAVISWSPDRSLVAIGSEMYGGHVEIRRAADGALQCELERSGGGGYLGVSIHPDGRSVAAGHSSGLVDVYDLRTGALTASLEAHRGNVYGVDWSPDGTRLVSGGNDNAVRVWDAGRFEQVLELRGHSQYVKAVAFSPDGTLLASTSGDGTLRLWDSLAPVERSVALRERLVLQAALQPRVAAWLQELVEPAAVETRIAEEFADDPARRLAALVELARALR